MSFSFKQRIEKGHDNDVWHIGAPADGQVHGVAFSFWSACSVAARVHRAVSFFATVRTSDLAGVLWLRPEAMEVPPPR